MPIITEDTKLTEHSQGYSFWKDGNYFAVTYYGPLYDGPAWIINEYEVPELLDRTSKLIARYTN